MTSISAISVPPGLKALTCRLVTATQAAFEPRRNGSQAEGLGTQQGGSHLILVWLQVLVRQVSRAAAAVGFRLNCVKENKHSRGALQRW